MADNPGDRNSEIWSLAQTGLPHAAIAERFGISRQRVSKLIGDMTPTAWGFTDRARAQIRAKEAATLERLSKDAEKVIASPPEMHSAIGKIILDSQGHPVLNEGVRIAAIRERRLLSESYRRLTGADLAAAGRMGEDEARAAAQASLAQLRAHREAEIADLKQREADVTRRERALAAVPQPGDDQVIDAEIVD